MKIWTSGTVDQVIEDAKTGLVDAIVTNPTVIADWCQNGISLEELAKKVIGETDLPLYIQLKGKTYSDYLKQYDYLGGVSNKIIPKLPSTFEGIQAAKRLEELGIETLVTTVCSLGQAYACASSKVTTICPYYNRLQENGDDADTFLQNLSNIYSGNSVKTKIIPASIRTLQDIDMALKNGSHGVIIFSKLFRELCDHAVTNSSMQGFDMDWEKINSGIQ